MTSPLFSLARQSVLRAAINTGNRALVQQDGDELRGVSPALARRLAAEAGARFQPVFYNGAGAVFADAGEDLWDVSFLAIDPVRAEKVVFTRPYTSIETTYAVRADAGLLSIFDLDKAGMRILTSKGSAYDLHLTTSLKHASLHRHGTPFESFAAFRTGSWDAVAGVRSSLVAAFGDDPDVRILPQVLTKVDQALALPHARRALLPALDAFVERALADGFVASALAARA